MTQPTQNGIAPETAWKLDAVTSLEALAKVILLADGDRDHMNTSRLTCEQTQTVAKLMQAVAAALQRQPAQFSQWNSAIFAAANAIRKAEPPKKPSPGNVLDRSDYYCTRADYVNAVLALAQSPSQGGEAIWCQACGSTVPNHHYATCPTKAPGAEAVVTLREKMVKALDGHTKYSRDCDMSGEFLTNQVWPMVEAAICPAIPAPAQGVTMTKDKNQTAETVETVISLARQAAFLHSQLTDSPDYPTMLFARLALLHDAMTVYDGEEPDLTFCCHCHELIEGGQFVMFGAKYHEVCVPLQAAVHPAESS